MFETLASKILEVVNANDLIQEAFDYEVAQFNGTPSATVTPSGNEADYQTTHLNERVYAFNIRLFVRREAYNNDHARVERVMRGLVDSVINDFDKDYYFAGLSVPTGYCMINIFAAPSQWGYVGREDEYRVAEVTIRCRVSVDITQIT